MVLTQEQIYDIYDGSWEHQFVDKLEKDIFGIHGLLPLQAVDVLTDDKINQTVDELATTITKLDGGDLGIRKEVMALGLTERYVGLKNALRDMGNDLEKASQEYVKKVLTLMPREILMLILNVDADEEERDFKLGLYATEVHNRLYQATDDKINVETLHFAKNLLESQDNGLEVFYTTIKKVISKIELYNSYIYEERYYNPPNLNRAIVNGIQEDMKWGNVSSFPINEFLVGDAGTENPLYNAYLDIIKPMKETKALENLRETREVDTVYNYLHEQDEVYNKSRYFYNEGYLVMLRDGLTIVEPNGEFRHIASSKVRQPDKDEMVKKMFI